MGCMAEDPFDAIVAAHHGEIFRYLRRLTGWSSHAEDLAQDTFLRAYRAYRGLGDGANVRAWLFTIATNVARNHIRAEQRRARAHAAARDVRSERDDTHPDGATMFNETRAVIDGVVARLPLKQRTAFILRKIHELEYDEIGRSLGCSPESARAHVFQALRKVRHGLDGVALLPAEMNR